MSWFSNQSDWEMKMCWASALRCFVQRVERTEMPLTDLSTTCNNNTGWIGFVIEWCAAGCCCKSVAGAYTHTYQYTCNILGMVTFKTQVTNLSGRKLSYFSVFDFVLLLFFVFWKMTDMAVWYTGMFEENRKRYQYVCTWNYKLYWWHCGGTLNLEFLSIC